MIPRYWSKSANRLGFGADIRRANDSPSDVLSSASTGFCSRGARRYSRRLDTCFVWPREVFRPAIARAAASIVLTHQHPSGDPTPSESDIKVTRDLVRAGQLLKIEITDHIIIGQDRHASLRELGYFSY